MFEFNKYISLINEKKLAEAVEYRKSNMPKKIYKYISLSDTYSCNKDNNQLCEVNKKLDELKFATLNENKLWLSRFENLNDPYEYRGIYLKKDELSSKGWPINNLEEYLNRMKNIFLICSFSKNIVDNMPMWAHYANNHRGFCIEYNVLNAKAVFPISYEKERIGIASILTDIFKLTDKIIEGKIDEHDKDFQFYMTLITHFALLKHKSWKYENEYRVLYADLGKSESGITIPSINVGLEVSKIYIGSQCSEKNKNKLINIANNIGAKAYQMYLDDKKTEYKLGYKPL